VYKNVSVVIINYGNANLVEKFLVSIKNCNDLDIVNEVIIVDNGYPQKGDSRVAINPSSFPFKVKFVQNPASSYASGVNQGIAESTRDFLVIANNDVELISNYSIRPLIEYLEQNPNVGIVGPQQIYPDGSWQRSYGHFPSVKEAMINLTMLDSICNGVKKATFRRNLQMMHNKKVDYIDGAFMVVRRSCFEDLGGFDEGYSFYAEEADFCLRAWKRGWKVVFIPGVRVMHIRGASSTAEALEDYTIRLLMAQQLFVKNHFGVCKSEWYMRLMRIALLERYIVYNLIAKIVRLPTWKQKASIAHVRYFAAKKVRLC